MRYHKRALLYSVSVPVAYKLAATFLSTVSFPALPTVVLSGRRRTCRKDACTFDILDRLVCHRDGGTGNLVGEAALVVMSFGRHSVGREGWVEIYIHPIIINARLFAICIAKGSSSWINPCTVQYDVPLRSNKSFATWGYWQRRSSLQAHIPTSSHLQ